MPKAVFGALPLLLLRGAAIALCAIFSFCNTLLSEKLNKKASAASLAARSSGDNFCTVSAEQLGTGAKVLRHHAVLTCVGRGKPYTDLFVGAIQSSARRVAPKQTNKPRGTVTNMVFVKRNKHALTYKFPFEPRGGPRRRLGQFHFSSTN